MASGAFSLVGCWYLVLMLWPQKFYNTIPFWGALMIVEGIIILVHGLRLHVAPFPFYGDFSSSIFGGIGIVLLAPRPGRIASDPIKNFTPVSLTDP